MAEATLSLNGSGVYSPNTAGQPVQSGTIITSTAFNALIDDMSTALSTALYKDGQQVATANQPMGGFRHTNIGDAVARTQYAAAGQVQDGALEYLTGVSGTNTILASVSPTPGAYAAGQRFTFIVGTTNTGATTLNVSSLGAKDVKKKMSGGKVALVAADLIAGLSAEVFYDGTDFVLETARTYSNGADVASAGTINLDTATGDVIDVTGTTSITAITLTQGEARTVRFTGALTLTNGASLVLPGAANITTAAGDFAIFRGYASGVVRCVMYSKASGVATVLAPVIAQIQPISASVAASALTITASQLSLEFRSATLTSGTVTSVTGTPANLVISSGSTLGTVSAIQSRIAVLVMNNAGTLELAAVNISGGTNLTETGVISTTAEGGAGAADAANVVYSTTARSNLAYRVVGYIESTQATAGTWATTPSTIQGAGDFAFGSIGYGQTWQDVTGSRAGSTTYYNATGRPIMVAITAGGTPSGVVLTIGGVSVIQSVNGAATSGNWSVSAIVPPGNSYSAVITGSIVTWAELR